MYNIPFLHSLQEKWAILKDKPISARITHLHKSVSPNIYYLRSLTELRQADIEWLFFVVLSDLDQTVVLMACRLLSPVRQERIQC